MFPKYQSKITRIILTATFLVVLLIPEGVLALDRPGLAMSTNESIRRSPGAPATFFIKPEDTTGASCAKSDPCDYYTARTNALSGDTLIFQAGTYNVINMGHPITPGELIAFNISVSLYGGWDGDLTPGVDPVIDPQAHQTILDGQDSYRIMTLTGSSNNSAVEGFTMENGYAEDAHNTACYAGGAAGTPACGGAIYVENASPTIRKNKLINNVAINNGTNSGIGGGIYAYNSQGIKIRDNEIYFNYANGSAYTGFGGGIFIYTCGVEAEIRGNNFWYNQAAVGTFNGKGAAIAVENCVTIPIKDNYFYYNNQGGTTNITGSAIYLSNSFVDLLDNVFMYNVNGSVVYLINSRGTIQRNYLNNQDADYGLFIYRGVTDGWFYVYNNMILNHDHANVYLLGVSSSYARVQFTFNTIAFNGTGIYDSGVSIGDYVNGIFTHGIITNHYYGFKDVSVTGGTSTISISYHLMYNDYYPYGDDGVFDGFPYTYGFTGDPLFVNVGSGDYHIQSGSPARDRGPGNPTILKDFDHQTRMYPPSGMTNAADLGADEYWPAYLQLYMPIIIR
jgi:hypothetical protein